MRRDLPKGWLSADLYPEAAELQRAARAEGIKGLAELCLRIGGKLDDTPDKEILRNFQRLMWKAEDAMANAWVDFWAREGVKLLTGPEMEISLRELIGGGVYAHYSGPEGEGSFVSGEWRAVMTDALVRAVEQIAKERRHFTDEEAEALIYAEIRVSLDRAYNTLMDGLWNELDGDVRGAIEAYWPKEDFRRGIKALLINNLNAQDRLLLDTVLTVKYHIEQEGSEASDRSLWRRVAEKLSRSIDHADRLKQRHYRLMKRLNEWIPTLAQHYASDPSSFDPFREAERLLTGGPGSTS